MKVMKKNDNNLFYTCSLIELIGRTARQKRKDVVNLMGEKIIRHIYHHADTLHCEPIAKIADYYIDFCHIPTGEFDNIASCKYTVPSYWDIGKVYARLIEDIQKDDVIFALIQVYNSTVSDSISYYNSDFFYQPRGFIKEQFLSEGNAVGEKTLKKPAIRFRGFTDAWEQRKVNEIADIVGGGTPSTHNPSYWDGDINWYAPAEMEGKRYAVNSERKITQAGLSNSSAKILPAGRTILFTSRAGIGKVAILQHDAATNQGFQSLVLKDGISPYFIYSMGSILKKKAEGIASGSTFLEISGKMLGNIDITIPSSSEQHIIADFFRNLDDLITLHQRKYDKLSKIKKSMLEKLFPKNGSNVPEIRFAGFTDAWEQRKIKEIFKVTRGYVLAATKTTSRKDNENLYPVYSSQTKDNGLMGYFSEYLYENAITWTTDGANAGTVNFRAGKFYCTNVCGVLLSDSGYANKMIAEALNRIAWRHVSKVGNPKLMNNVMSEIVLQLPLNFSEQKKISTILQTIDRLITLHQRELEKLRNIKKACLEKMFV